MKWLDGYLRLFIGVVLSGAIAAWIAEELRLHSAEYEAAAHIFQSHSELLGKRLYLMNQVYYALSDPARADEVEKGLDAYREFLGSYNAQRGYNRVMIELYFGQPLWNAERDVHHDMRLIGQKLECWYRDRKHFDASGMDDALSGEWVKLSDFTKAMGAALRDKKIGADRDIAAVPQSDIPNFTCPGAKLVAGP